MGYDKFIQIGIDRQRDSITIDEATRQYSRSCECCAEKGYNSDYDCDYTCPITIAHRDKLDTIRTLRQLEHERSVRKMQQHDDVRSKLHDAMKIIQDVCDTMCDHNNIPMKGGEE